MSTYTLRRILQCLFFIGLLTPLIFAPKHFTFPYVVPKAIFFHIDVVFLFTLAILLYWYERNKKQANILFFDRIKKFFTPVAALVFLFFVSSIISSFLGVDIYRSLWDGQERMLGLYTLFHYVIFFFIGRNIFSGWHEWRWVFLIFGTVGMLVIAVAIFQTIQPEFYFNRGLARPVSTVGNPIYLAGLGLFLFFSSLFAYRLEKREWARWMFLVFGLLGIISIIISQTRGAGLGFIAGLLVIAVILLFSKITNHRQKLYIGGAMALIVLSFIFAFIFRHISFVRNMPIVGDIVTISPFEGSAKTRVMAWNIGFRGWLDRPMFGWGMNNYGYIFNTYYNPEFLHFGDQETWFDNAHNIFVNTLATQGVIGFSLYVGLYIAALFILWRLYHYPHKEDQEEYRWVAIISAAFLFAHAIHTSFVFENITSYLYFFLFLAFLDAIYDSTCREQVKKSESVYATHISPVMFVISISVGIVISFIVDVRILRANYFGFESRNATHTGQIEESIVWYKKAEAMESPLQSDIDWDFAADQLTVLLRVYSYDKDAARELYDLSKAAMERYIAKHPLDVRARLVYMDVLRNGGIVLFELEETKELVEEQLRIAESLSPGRQQVEYAKITYYAGTNRFDEAVALAEALIVRDPLISEGYSTLARLYHFGGQYKEILKTIDRALYAGAYFLTVEEQIFAAETYEREGRFLDALYWYDQAYKQSGNERIIMKRDELSRLTQLMVPSNIEEFFPPAVTDY